MQNPKYTKGDIVITRCKQVYQLVDDPVEHPEHGLCANVRKYRTNIVHGIRLSDVRHHPLFL